MYGLTRKDINNRTKLGVTSYGIICLALFLLVFYISSKATKTTKPVITDQKATVSVAETQKSLNRWDKIRVETPDGQIAASKRRVIQTGSKQQAAKPDQAVLEIQGVALTELKTNDMMEYRPQLADQPTSLEAVISQTKFAEQLPGSKVERSDDGRTYLRTRGGVFTPGAEAGLKLVGPGNTAYVVGDDGLLYGETAEGKRVKLDKPPTGLLRDLKSRYYRLDSRTREVQIASPGGPGAFRGPDGLNYAVGPQGTIQNVEGGKLVDTTLKGAGEFTGTDGQPYILAEGLIFAKLTADVSFGEKNITGVGHFRDPSGQLLLRGEDGKVYGYDEEQNTRRANLKGVGSFTGPDGSLYRRDEGGNIVRLVGANASSQVKERPAVASGSPGGGSPKEPAAEARGLSGTSWFSSNPNNYSAGKPADPADKAAATLKGGVVYSAPDDPPARAAEPEQASGSKDFLPLGRRIPFYILTKVSTQFDQPGMVEATVAENVFFHDAVLPAGVRLYGSVRATGRNNRMDITFTTMVFPDGRELTVSGQVFDVNMNYGLEAYVKPLPSWVKMMRYAQVPVLSTLAKAANANATTAAAEGSPTYNFGSGTNSPAQDYAVNLIKRTQEELEQENAAYLVLPMGTPGILVLTNRLALKPTYGASAAGAPAMAPSLSGTSAQPVGNPLPALANGVMSAVNAASASVAKEGIGMLEPLAGQTSDAHGGTPHANPLPKNDGSAVNSIFGNPGPR